MLFRVDLTVDLIARAAGASHSLRPFTTVRAATLCHESRNHTVKSEAVVEPVFCQFDEVSDCFWRISLEQLELNLACFGVHQGLGHGGASKETL